MSEWKETEIGLIPFEYEEYELSDVIDYIVDNRGKTPPSNSTGFKLIETYQIFTDRIFPLYDENQKYVSAETYNSWFRAGHPKQNDILFTTVGERVPQFCLVESDDLCIAQNLIAIRLKSDLIYPIYLLNYFRQNKFIKQVKNRLLTTAQPSIKVPHLLELLIYVPCLEEQKRIADVLSCLDAKIENLRQQNNTLEQIAQTLFKHWFIDFEFPNTDGKPYKSSGGEMQSSVLGDIPKGWRVGKLGDVVEVFMGYPFKSEFYTFNSGIRVVRGENVSLGFLRWDTEKRWEKNLDLYKDYFLATNDYVIGMDGSRVGRNRTIILKSDLPIILAQRVARLRSKDIHIQGYINILLMNNRFEKYVDFIKTGTSIPHISGEQIKNFECIIPSKQQLKNFSSFYNAWAKKTSIIRQQIETLTKTRDALLPKLMSGQIRIEE